jgi:hypothetical protein
LPHQQKLVNTEHALQLVIQGVDKGITNDILAKVIPAQPAGGRQALHHLGEIIRRWADRQVLENSKGKYIIFVLRGEIKEI